MPRNLTGELSGFRPDVDIKIVYTGLRPGEKLFEELFDPGETLSQTGAPGILAASPRYIERALITRIIDDLHRLVENHDVAGALRLLLASELGFTPNAEIAAMMNAGGSDRARHSTLLEEGGL